MVAVSGKTPVPSEAVTSVQPVTSSDLHAEYGRLGAGEPLQVGISKVLKTATDWLLLLGWLPTTRTAACYSVRGHRT